VRGVDYEDDKSILQAFGILWWLKHKSCKDMLMCLIHKNNPDLSTKPTKLPPGIIHKESRIEKVAALATKRVVDKTKQPPTPINEMDHQMNTARVARIRLQVEKNKIDSIGVQIAMLRSNDKEVYV
jgi:hypothetical protein